MHQLFIRPDRYFARSGRLDCATVERRIPDAPPFMRGLRVLFVSDPHVLARTRQADIEALSGRIAALSPDMLLLGGDYADRHEDALRLFEAFRPLRFTLGAFGVWGNNDAEAWGQPDGLRRAMAAAGCRLLVNEAARIPLPGGTLHIAGVDERKFGAPSAKGLFPEGRAPDAYRILLAHYPSMPDAIPDLMVSGHTHGGQFNLLGLTPFSIGFERLFRPSLGALAVAGLHDINGMKLSVSKGIGASRIQWRIGVRPEMDLLRFD